MKRSFLSIITVLILFCGKVYGQDNQNEKGNTDSSKTFNLTVLTNLQDASVYIDSVFAGKTPLKNYKTKEGVYILRVVNPQISQKWNVENFSSKILITGDTTVQVDFETFYLITSTPFNTEIHYNDSLIGLTPLRFYSKKKLEGDILFSKEEYFDSVISISGYNFSDVIDVKLKEKRYGQSTPFVFKNKETNFKSGRNFLAIGSFGAGLILSAYSAIHTKSLANGSYDRYLATGSQQEYDDSNRYDAFSLVSLIVMEAAIAGLIYFLFID